MAASSTQRVRVTVQLDSCSDLAAAAASAGCYAVLCAEGKDMPTKWELRDNKTNMHKNTNPEFDHEFNSVRLREGAPDQDVFIVLFSKGGRFSKDGLLGRVVIATPDYPSGKTWGRKVPIVGAKAAGGMAKVTVKIEALEAGKRLWGDYAMVALRKGDAPATPGAAVTAVAEAYMAQISEVLARLDKKDNKAYATTSRGNANDFIKFSKTIIATGVDANLPAGQDNIRVLVQEVFDLADEHLGPVKCVASYDDEPFGEKKLGPAAKFIVGVKKLSSYVAQDGDHIGISLVAR